MSENGKRASKLRRKQICPYPLASNHGNNFELVTYSSDVPGLLKAYGTQEKGTGESVPGVIVS